VSAKHSADPYGCPVTTLERCCADTAWLVA
jgi:hypothetical protein